MRPTTTAEEGENGQLPLPPCPTTRLQVVISPGSEMTQGKSSGGGCFCDLMTAVCSDCDDFSSEGVHFTLTGEQE